MTGFVVMGTAGTAQADDEPEAPNDHQIAICHATGEGTDGKYVIVYPSKKQISDDHGHRTGQESVHPDDIIPPFAAGSVSEAEATSWEAFAGQNWDSAGQAIFNNGCVNEDDDDDDEEEEQPDPVTSTSSSSRVDCTTATVVTTTTTTTTEYVEDEDGDWVLGTPQVSTSTSSRPATNAELDQANCPRPNRPEPIVTTTSVDDVDCEDNVVTTTTTTTTVDWVFDVASRTWVKGEPQVSTTQTVRDATEAECPVEVLPSESVDVCPNIAGDQEAVPEGYSMVGGECIEDEVEGVETEKPEPTVVPVVDTPEAVPTAVDAGFGPAASATPDSLLGQGLVGAGLMMLLLAGTMQMGRRERGAHQA